MKYESMVTWTTWETQTALSQEESDFLVKTPAREVHMIGVYGRPSSRTLDQWRGLNGIPISESEGQIIL